MEKFKVEQLLFYRKKTHFISWLILPNQTNLVQIRYLSNSEFFTGSKDKLQNIDKAPYAIL